MMATLRRKNVRMNYYSGKKQGVKVEPESTSSNDKALPNTAIPTNKHIKLEYDHNSQGECSKSPPNWKEVYHLIEQFRSTHQAPVDMFGCSASGSWGEISPRDSRYRTLISLMLSSQTKDETTFEAVRSLAEHGLTVSNILQTSEQKINELICKVGFHNRKAGYIKRATEILHEQHNDDVPHKLEQIVALPGVGPKMAYLLLQTAWQHSEGIGVDVHVHNISNRLGWANSTSPEQTRKQLELWLPKEYWVKINKMLVGFGQTICKKPVPKCEMCPVSGLCPSSRAKCEEEHAVVKKKKKRANVASALSGAESEEEWSAMHGKKARPRGGVEVGG